MSELRDAYVPNRRVRVASDIAGLSAVLLLIGLLGAAVTWWGRSDLFDLASSSLESVKIDIGFLVGPVLILVALPLVFGRRRQVVLKRLFKTRIVIAALLWLVGLGLLLGRVLTLDASYELEGGFYVSAALLAVGLVATVAMWPGGLAVVQVDRNRMVYEPTAAAPRGRSRTGP